MRCFIDANQESKSEECQVEDVFKFFLDLYYRESERKFLAGAIFQDPIDDIEEEIGYDLSIQRLLSFGFQGERVGGPEGDGNLKISRDREGDIRVLGLGAFDD